MRTSPNVIITGTPGVGKTVHCEQLAEETGLRHLSINHVAKERDCYETYDHELQTWVVDEDKLLDAIEDQVLQDAEIFGVLLDEAREAFDEELVVELNSERDDDVESNCARISSWVQSWKNDRA
ncbi:ATP-dependent protease La 2 [Aspergillus luchuensis]|uniref:ATP-dependent protease La 2 n=1 Tax=Aspergillus kawachii TaxID=1069201 RepID=A0A146FYD2_ASPKA|nr:ATP-dependent protease La 2 [Aspergillus luchuensis]